MKVLKSWLKDFIPIENSDEELAEKLSLSGTSVESISKGIDEKVVVAEIKEVLPHQKADRLQIAKVFDGKDLLQIVCGAPNIRSGQKVPLAKIGAVLPCLEIKEATIRGVQSFGMLCAADELGFSEDHSGIMILPDEYIPGKPLCEYFGKDTLLDLEITSNRGDEHSHLGVAREIAAITGADLSIAGPVELLKSKNIKAKIEKVDILDSSACFQYYGQQISGVKIAPSPKWLQDRLKELGLKPINNIVDITNFILLDLGQPLHAFDLNKITPDTIVIRKANEYEKLITLDGTERNLNQDDLVIADKEKAIALAGIMGAGNSEIDGETADIFIESAEFDPVTIRRSAKRLGLQTEASYRFERGIDSGRVKYALNKCVRMILENAGGEITGEIVSAGEEPVAAEILFDREKINTLLGTDIPEQEIVKILTSLGFIISGNKVAVPKWRHDVKIWQDLAEEVGRIYGYDKIIRTAIDRVEKPKPSKYFYAQFVKDLFCQQGFSEVITYSFLSEKDLKAADINSSDLLEIANPLQTENKYLRKSLLPGLLKAVAKNPAFDRTLVYEIGSTFSTKGEVEKIAIIAAGKDAKNAIQSIAECLTREANLPVTEIPIKELSRDELQKFKIKKPICYLTEIEFDKLYSGLKNQKINLDLSISKKVVNYRPISKYPSVTRDLAFIVNEQTSADDVVQDIYSVSDQIARVELFDEFKSDRFGLNKKNIAYHIFIQDMNKTMKDEEAEQIISSIVKIIEEKYDAKLRII